MANEHNNHCLNLLILQLEPLVPVHQFDKLPSYYIFAGLVLIPLTQPYLHEYGEDWYNTSPRRLCEHALRELPKKAGEQLVILSQVCMLLLLETGLTWLFIYLLLLAISFEVRHKYRLFHWLSRLLELISFWWHSILLQVLMDEVNAGYERLAEMQVPTSSPLLTL